MWALFEVQFGRQTPLYQAHLPNLSEWPPIIISILVDDRRSIPDVFRDFVGRFLLGSNKRIFR